MLLYYDICAVSNYKKSLNIPLQETTFLQLVLLQGKHFKPSL